MGGDVVVLPVTLGAAVQEPCSSLSKVGARDFGSAEGAIGVLHFPVGDAVNLIIAVILPRRFCICASPSLAGGLHGDLVQAEVIGDDGGVYSLLPFEPVAILGDKPTHSGREANVSHRIAPVAKSTQAGPDK
jgi:hypothetical protein